MHQWCVTIWLYVAKDPWNVWTNMLHPACYWWSPVWGITNPLNKIIKEFTCNTGLSASVV
mgnify:CR=1 FL=1